MNYPNRDKTPARPPLRYLSPLHRAVRAIQEHLARQADGLDVEPGHAHLVSYLSSYGPVPVGDLAPTLDLLERRGLIAFHADRYTTPTAG